MISSIKQKKNLILRYILVFVLAVSLVISYNFPMESYGSSQSVSTSHKNSLLPIAMPLSSTNQNNVNSDALSTYSVVNPYRHYMTEPAPIGITDFGIGPNGVPYSYNTTSFRGTISLENLSVVNKGRLGDSGCMGFQLNVVLCFKSGSSTYSYWVQNAAKINTKTHCIVLIDNIWNFTGSIYSMPDCTVLGYGGIIHNFDANFYEYSYPVSGEFNTPLNLTLQTNVTTYNDGVPELQLMYNIGNGFVTYDEPQFVFTNIATNPVFKVDGSQYALSNETFYDAELIMGGPSGGADIYDQSSNITMQLQYWNGWNYQYVPNAYNFGANTAEGSCNVIASAFDNSRNDILGSRLAQGNGSLGQIYNSANLSFFHLKVPFLHGIMELNGRNFTFTRGQLDLTLPYYAGLQQLKIMNNNRVVYSTNITLNNGQYKYLALTNLTFNENISSLKTPEDFKWCLDINGTEYNTSGKSLSFCLPVGNYTYSASYSHETIPFYNENGTLFLNSNNKTINLYFFEKVFELTLHPFGLQSGTPWNVSVKGVNTYYGSYPNSIQIYLPNGTFTFNVGNIAGYSIISNSSVMLKVNGSSQYYNIAFIRERAKPPVYIITFLVNNYPIVVLISLVTGIVYWYYRVKIRSSKGS